MSQLKQIANKVNDRKDVTDTKAPTINKVTSIETEGTPSTCLEKLKSLINKLENLSDISLSELAEKLGLELEELIENGIEEIRELLKDIDPSKIEEAFEKILKSNSIYDALKKGVKDIRENIGEALEDGAEWIETKIKNAIDDLKDFSLKKVVEDVFQNTLPSVINLAKEIGDQLNRKACNGQLLAELADLIGDIENSISDYLDKLTGKDIRDLLNGKTSSLDLAKALRVGIVANSIYEMFNNDDLNSKSFMSPPTNKTINNPNEETSITLNTSQLSAVSGVVIDYKFTGIESVETESYKTGGLWDPEEEVISNRFGYNTIFVITGDAISLITNRQFQELLDEKYTDLYTNVDYDKPTITTVPSLDTSSKLNTNDVMINISITGDTEVQSADDIFTAALTLSYVVSKRVRVKPDDDCNDAMQTESIIQNSIQFFGLGISSENARFNAFLESKNKVLNELTSHKTNIINYQ